MRKRSSERTRPLVSCRRPPSPAHWDGLRSPGTPSRPTRGTCDRCTCGGRTPRSPETKKDVLLRAALLDAQRAPGSRAVRGTTRELGLFFAGGAGLVRSLFLFLGHASG